MKMQKGNRLIVTNPNDKRLRMYEDSSFLSSPNRGSAFNFPNYREYKRLAAENKKNPQFPLPAPKREVLLGTAPKKQFKKEFNNYSDYLKAKQARKDSTMLYNFSQSELKNVSGGNPKNWPLSVIDANQRQYSKDQIDAYKLQNSTAKSRASMPWELTRIGSANENFNENYVAQKTNPRFNAIGASMNVPQTLGQNANGTTFKIGVKTTGGNYLKNQPIVSGIKPSYFFLPQQGGLVGGYNQPSVIPVYKQKPKLKENPIVDTINKTIIEPLTPKQVKLNIETPQDTLKPLPINKIVTPEVAPKKLPGGSGKFAQYPNMKNQLGSLKTSRMVNAKKVENIVPTFKEGVNLVAGGEKHKVYVKKSPTGVGKGVKGHVMVNHPTEDKGKWDTIDLTEKAGAKTVEDGKNATKKWHKENPMKKYKIKKYAAGSGGAGAGGASSSSSSSSVGAAASSSGATSGVGATSTSSTLGKASFSGGDIGANSIGTQYAPDASFYSNSSSPASSKGYAVGIGGKSKMSATKTSSKYVPTSKQFLEELDEPPVDIYRDSDLHGPGSFFGRRNQNPLNPNKAKVNQNKPSFLGGFLRSIFSPSQSRMINSRSVGRISATGPKLVSGAKSVKQYRGDENLPEAKNGMKKNCGCKHSKSKYKYGTGALTIPEGSAIVTANGGKNMQALKAYKKGNYKLLNKIIDGMPEDRVDKAQAGVTKIKGKSSTDPKTNETFQEQSVLGDPRYGSELPQSNAEELYNLSEKDLRKSKKYKPITIAQELARRKAVANKQETFQFTFGGKTYRGVNNKGYSSGYKNVPNKQPGGGTTPIPPTITPNPPAKIQQDNTKYEEITTGDIKVPNPVMSFGETAALGKLISQGVGRGPQKSYLKLDRYNYASQLPKTLQEIQLAEQAGRESARDIVGGDAGRYLAQSGNLSSARMKAANDAVIQDTLARQDILNKNVDLSNTEISTNRSLKDYYDDIERQNLNDYNALLVKGGQSFDESFDTWQKMKNENQMKAQELQILREANPNYTMIRDPKTGLMRSAYRYQKTPSTTQTTTQPFTTQNFTQQPFKNIENKYQNIVGMARGNVSSYLQPYQKDTIPPLLKRPEMEKGTKKAKTYKRK